MKAIFLSSILLVLSFATYSQSRDQLITRGVFLEESLEQCDSLYRFERLTASLLAQKEKYQADKIMMLSHDIATAKGNVTICEKNALKQVKEAKRKGRIEGGGATLLVWLLMLLLI